jgi:hypothetical protein
MKKIIGLFSLLLVLNGCDDGDLTVETIDFTDVTAVKCNLNDLIYKLKGNEILALEIPASQNAFINEPTIAGTPRIIALSTTNRVVYRSYNGTAAADNICATVPASTPIVTEEWTAISGNVQITTTPVYITDPITNATKISKYNHYIVFKDITFNKPNGNQLYETFVFGNYQTTPTSLPFAFDVDLIQKCSTSDEIYNFSGSESLVLKIPSTMYPNAVGTVSDLISATNTVTYKLFNGGLSQSYFCISPAPSTPTLNQEWNAQNGVSGVSGIIEVETTTETASSFRHTIHLKKATFQKGNSTFYLGDDYIYGSFVTN